MDFLRNLPTQQPQQLTQLIQIQPGRVVSMAMSRQEHCQMTLLAFGDGESISEECYLRYPLLHSGGGALCLCGGGQPLSSNGDCLAVPAHTPHAVVAPDGCKLLQITLS